MIKKKRVVVVGAGIAGLTLSYKLSCEGYNVLLVEKEGSVGGLAKSFTYEGDFSFDVGPHRFYTKSTEVNDFIHEVLGDASLRIRRRSGVRMFDRYYEWPLSMSSIFNMPVTVLLSVGRDMLTRGQHNGPNFEEYILNKYGRTLYHIFFKPYTEKFLGVSCAGISRDWAVMGLDRAVIDSKIKVDDLFSMLRSLFLPQPPLEFMYPKSGGIGSFSEELNRKFLDNNGILLLKSEITGIRSNTNGEIEKVILGDREYECDLLVWTGSLTDMTRLLGLREAALRYIDLLLYNYCLDEEAACHYQWCYFGSDDVPFNRVSIPTLFSPAMAPRGKSGVCVEVTCHKEEALWRDPLSMEPEIRKALVKNTVIKNGNAIINCHVERLTNAYPIYTLDYAAQLSLTMSELQRVRNLKMLGRTGTFWYNNMDHSIEAALRLYREITTHV